MQKSTIFKTTTNPPFKTAANDEKTNDPQITTVRNQ